MSLIQSKFNIHYVLGSCYNYAQIYGKICPYSHPYACAAFTHIVYEIQIQIQVHFLERPTGETINGISLINSTAQIVI